MSATAGTPALALPGGAGVRLRRTASDHVATAAIVGVALVLLAFLATQQVQ